MCRFHPRRPSTCNRVARLLAIVSVAASSACGSSERAEEPWLGEQPLDAAFWFWTGPTESQLGGPYGPAEVRGFRLDRRSTIELGHLDEQSSQYAAGAWSSDRLRVVVSGTIVSVDGAGHVRRTSRSMHSFAWSPDGALLAFTLDGRAFVGDADGQNAVSVPTPSYAYFMEWSPDGSKIVVESWNSDGWTLLIVDASGAELAEFADAERFSWSPDSQALLIAGTGGTSLVHADGSDSVSVDPRALNWLGWSSDARWFAFREAHVETAHGPTIRTLVVVSADGAQHEEIVGVDDIFPVWSPVDAELAFASNGRVELWSIDGREETALNASEGSLYWSPDGSTLLSTSPFSWLAPSTGNDPLAPADYQWDDAFGSPFSPDGSRLLALSSDFALSVFETEGGGATLLTPNAVHDQIWLPDGQHVGFATDSELSVTDVTTTDDPTVWSRKSAYFIH